jgi:uncharacterized membrane protein
MRNLLVHLAEKILLLQSLKLGGDYRFGMGFGWLFGILVLILVILAIAALVKYLMK